MRIINIFFLIISAFQLNGCALVIQKSVVHEFANSVTAYGYPIEVKGSTSIRFTHIRFGERYSRDELQPVNGVSVNVDGKVYDLGNLDKDDMASSFVKTDHCSKEKENGNGNLEWTSCMNTFSWVILIDDKINYLEFWYYPLTDREQPTIINQNSKVTYQLPLTEKDLFSLFGMPSRTYRYIRP